MPVNMIGERALAAMARIDRALARIESAAPGSGGETVLALAELKLRHQALKQEAQQSLADIDHVIAQAGARQG